VFNCNFFFQIFYSQTGILEMASLDIKKRARVKRKKRIRKKLSGTTARPRLSVFRSAKHIYAQVIDDAAGHTLVSASSVEKAVKEQQVDANSKVELATAVGKQVAERAIKKGLKQVVFDRNGFLYHGRVKAVADGAREAGLEF
jgi:large subunit ribosomal protein L18